jgi:hypothetical protein
VGLIILLALLVPECARIASTSLELYLTLSICSASFRQPIPIPRHVLSSFLHINLKMKGGVFLRRIGRYRIKKNVSVSSDT